MSQDSAAAGGAQLEPEPRGGHVVIIGGGQAASECAAQLRQKGFAGPITLICEEPYLPYQRPPLSKAFLAGEVTADSLRLRTADAYARLDVTVKTGLRADKIDRHARTIACGEESIGYSWLILATGGRARSLRVPGAGLANIHTLRTISDVQKLQSAFEPGRRLTIVGGGYVGLEVAAIAVKRGMAVTVLEGESRVLARVAAPEISAFYERVHRAEGVDIRTNVVVSGFVAGAGGAEVAGVECGEGPALPTDMVIVGIGLIPNTELAENAGLIVDGGIVADANCRTADPHIFAIGDCAVHAHHGFLDRRVRLESVPNAIEAARSAACAIMGQAAPQATAPWFWSDQYALKLQMVGLPDGYDSVAVRGSQESKSFIAFYLKDDRVVAADAINKPGEFMIAKRLVGERRSVSTAALMDETVSLKMMLLS